jgi:hypothetical protein
MGYQNRTVELSDETWKHIQDAHPEISIEDIKQSLVDPFEVRRSQSKENVELFYHLKSREPKLRYRLVVVKLLAQGCFISTAMTTSQIKNGEVLYKKPEGERS